MPWTVPVAGTSAGAAVSWGGASWADNGRLIKAKAIKQKHKDIERNNRRHNTGLDNKATLSWEQNAKAILRC